MRNRKNRFDRGAAALIHFFLCELHNFDVSTNESEEIKWVSRTHTARIYSYFHLLYAFIHRQCWRLAEFFSLLSFVFIHHMNVKVTKLFKKDWMRSSVILQLSDDYVIIFQMLTCLSIAWEKNNFQNILIASHARIAVFRVFPHSLTFTRFLI